MLALFVNACATPSVYVAREDGKSVYRHSTTDKRVPPPNQLDELDPQHAMGADDDSAFYVLQARCYAIERERDTQVTRTSATRFSLLGLAILLGAAGTVVAATSRIPNDVDDQNLMVGFGAGTTALSTAMFTMVATSDAGRRIQANREHRQQVRRVLHRSFAYKSADAEEKRNILRDMGDTCARNGDVEGLAPRDKELSDAAQRAIAEDLPELPAPVINPKPKDPVEQSSAPTDTSSEQESDG